MLRTTWHILVNCGEFTGLVGPFDEEGARHGAARIEGHHPDQPSDLQAKMSKISVRAYVLELVGDPAIYSYDIYDADHNPIFRSVYDLLGDAEYCRAVNEALGDAL